MILRREPKDATYSHISGDFLDFIANLVPISPNFFKGLGKDLQAIPGLAAKARNCHFVLGFVVGDVLLQGSLLRIGVRQISSH